MDLVSMLLTSYTDHLENMVSLSDAALPDVDTVHSATLSHAMEPLENTLS